MDSVIDASIATRRFERNLLLIFAFAAMLLACFGIYGVVAYTAAQRTREIGIRMAVGATPGDIYSLIVQQGLAPVLLGAAAGVVIAVSSGRLVASMLFQVSTYDPVVITASTTILLMVGFCACIYPAWRATTTDPTQALRFD